MYASSLILKSPNCLRLLALVPLLVFAHFSDVSATTIHVPSQTATIQAGLDAAQNGDTVLVAAGTYTGTGNCDLDFQGRQIVLVSASGAQTTIIDCQANPYDTHRAFYFHSGEDSGAVVRGFTITNGFASVINYLEIGGGIVCIDASPAFVECIIRNNYSWEGGGVYSENSSARFISCQFIDNNAEGMVCKGGAPRLSYCVFSGNRNAEYNNYTQLCFKDGATGTATNCTIIGGGVTCSGGSSTMQNSIIGWSIDCPPIACGAGGQIALSCCDIFGSANGDWVGCIAGQGSINGNFSANAEFCSLSSENFQIRNNSPCAPANNSCGILIGAMDVACGGGLHVWHVKADGTGDAPTIQAAIDSCSSGDTILVASGSYSGAGNRDLDFSGKMLLLKSESGMDSTMIVCGGTIAEPHRGFYFHMIEDSNAVVDGFTIINGFAEKGAGVYCGNSSPKIINCHLRHNTVPGSAWGYQGAGVYCSYGSPIIRGCVFTDNSPGDGSAVYAWEANPLIANCTMSGNNTLEGGIITSSENSHVTITNCILSANKGFVVDSAYGGALTVTCNVFAPHSSDFGTDPAAAFVGVNGNFTANPLFCNAFENDFHLQDASPCLPANNGCGQSIGALGVGCYRENRVWSVTPTGSGDALTIQAAIDNSSHGDTIIVSNGTFAGVGNRDLDFRGKAIVLRSQNGSANSIIDCQGSGGNPRRGFYFHCDEDSASTVSGITITGGYGVPDSTMYNLRRGGGAYCTYSSPTFKQCVFRQNHGNTTDSDSLCYGGAISAVSSLLALDGCDIDSNFAIEGGGISAFGGKLSLRDCRIIGNNNAGLVASGLARGSNISGCTFKNNVGWAADVGGDSVAVMDCLFQNNNSGLSQERGTMVVKNCRFIDQTSSGFLGFGSFSTPSLSVVSDCLFLRNLEGISGSGVTINATNCTFVFNERSIYEAGATLNFTRCIISYTATGPAISASYIVPQLTCCDIYGNSGGDWVSPYASQLGIRGNVRLDPQFCDTAASDFHLLSTSPCAPANNSCASLIGVYDVGCAGSHICGDANSDLAVDISDVVYLISYIFSGGAAPNPYEAGDVNCDDTVDISDAVYLIAYIFSGGSAPCAECK